MQLVTKRLGRRDHIGLVVEVEDQKCCPSAIPVVKYIVSGWRQKDGNLTRERRILSR